MEESWSGRSGVGHRHDRPRENSPGWSEAGTSKPGVRDVSGRSPDWRERQEQRAEERLVSGPLGVCLNDFSRGVQR